MKTVYVMKSRFDQHRKWLHWPIIFDNLKEAETYTEERRDELDPSYNRGWIDFQEIQVGRPKKGKDDYGSYFKRK